MALKLDPLAYPPRGMSRVVAARYIGLSTTKFDELVSDGRMPPPIRQPGNLGSHQNRSGVQRPSGWVLPQAPGDAIDQWYSRLGFDSATMNQEDMDRLQLEASEQWKARLIGSPLGKRERDALSQFASFEPGQLVRHGQVKCGIDTGERLETRGYIEVRYVSGDAMRLEGWVLTEAGKAAAQAVAAGADPANEIGVNAAPIS